MAGRSGEMSLYRKSSYDQIFSVPSSSSTGFTTISRNAGNLRNKGIELSIGGRPIETRLFSWDGRINWAKNRSEVLSLAPGVTSIYLSGYSWPQIRIMEGQPYGVIWGYGWKKNCVAADPVLQRRRAGHAAHRRRRLSDQVGRSAQPGHGPAGLDGKRHVGVPLRPLRRSPGCSTSATAES